MTGFLESFLIEIALFSFLGLIYYFYQRKKILHFEENKHTLIMSSILQACLIEKKETHNPELDGVIESIDDFLQGRVAHPPYVLLKYFMNSTECASELKEVIYAGLVELEAISGKE